MDPLTGRWVVVSPNRSGRMAWPRSRVPEAGTDESPCPFCPGNEALTRPAVAVYGPPEAWLVRVVPNLYPIFEGPEALTVAHQAPLFTEAPGGGVHEVVVFSPDHEAGWADLSDSHVELAAAALRERILEHARTPGVRYSQALVNCGREAGASIPHPHGQVLGMPFVPPEIAGEQAGFARFSGGCLLCTTAAVEAEGPRVVHADDGVVVLCPFWSSAPYEMLVVPRAHAVHLHAASPSDAAAVGRALRDALRRLRACVGAVPHNLVFHSAPFPSTGPYHWHVHVVPKLTTPAGFEFGTGVMVNVVPPETAASHLRAADGAGGQA